RASARDRDVGRAAPLRRRRAARRGGARGTPRRGPAGHAAGVALGRLLDGRGGGRPRGAPQHGDLPARPHRAAHRARPAGQPGPPRARAGPDHPGDRPGRSAGLNPRFSSCPCARYQQSAAIPGLVHMAGDQPRRQHRKEPDTREVAMKPPPFAYAAPDTVEEAVGLLTEHADAEPRVLAGGQSLIPLMNFRLAKPGYLVDLRNVAGLSGIRRERDVLVIGAMTKMAEVERSPEVAVAAPLRNSGTVGGSLAHADPAAELPAVALALDADLVAAGPGGTRVIPAAEFF